MKAMRVSFLKKGWQSVLLEFPAHQLPRTLVAVPLGALNTLLGLRSFNHFTILLFPFKLSEFFPLYSQTGPVLPVRRPHKTSPCMPLVSDLPLPSAPSLFTRPEIIFPLVRLSPPPISSSLCFLKCFHLCHLTQFSQKCMYVPWVFVVSFCMMSAEAGAQNKTYSAQCH